MVSGPSIKKFQNLWTCKYFHITTSLLDTRYLLHCLFRLWSLEASCFHMLVFTEYEQDWPPNYLWPHKSCTWAPIFMSGLQWAQWLFIFLGLNVATDWSCHQFIVKLKTFNERKLGLVGGIIQQLLFDKGYITTITAILCPDLISNNMKTYVRLERRCQSIKT